MPCRIGIICTTLIFIIFPGISSAEAYRWVDDQGKVHFGDRPPDKSKAKDISNDIKTQNLDSASSKAQAQLEQLQRRESAKEIEEKQLSEGSKQKQLEISKACEQARKRLRILKGRVIFYDREGNEIKTTEKERAAQAAQMEQQIRQYCG